MRFIAALAAAVTGASAHTIFQQVYVNGVAQGHTTGIRVPTYDGPITDVTSNDVICNGGPNPLNQPLPKDVITVAAGAQVTAEWHHTLAGADPSDSADPIDPGHLGPVMTYLAKVNNATQTDVTGLKWFKIWEDGMDANGQWGVTRMVANKGKVTFTIPSCIPAGDYLMRHELIALHGASSYPGAQLYMECAQLHITGGGSTQPATVNFPGAYSGTDPGIKINIYYPPVTSYTIPGPAVFSCSGNNPAPPVSTPNPPASTATATPTKPVATTASSTTAAPAATQTKFGQCGGQGFTGPTVCASGSTCTASSVYYSQCL
ncbi:hypothetical protein EXIGLDRAFT_760893 [Exidia glandulosa HHB12029]|uniref:AA9 family lytic polysaccharide monooxygenase n=1 Tax=Exidia glandulosa HHB12029 TaxID=1314781 RepID=A0A165NYL3_EXIGL|nr:hypothetical protein EXIGLDRAFT_760893 [Exidia glandulosa HHB12029]